MHNQSTDVVEIRHEALNSILQRACRYILNMADTHSRCKVLNCEGDCEICEDAFMHAQEARRDVLRYVDEHYSLIQK